MSKYKVFSVGFKYDTVRWIPGSIACHKPEDADLIVFPGGADVNPALYGEAKHPKTAFDMSLDVRDEFYYKTAMKLGIPMLGICRGAQFLCVKAGGRLVQDQANEARHKMMTSCGKKILVNSSHHQAMYPWNLEKERFAILGWSCGVSDKHEDGAMKEMVNGVVPGNAEVEVAYFPLINSLCIQSHPEWVFESEAFYGKEFDAFKDYSVQTVLKFLKGNVLNGCHDCPENFTTVVIPAPQS